MTSVLPGEDVFVGYRYYDTKQVPVRFASGHGLSHTDSLYSNLQLSAPALQDGQTVTVSVDVTTGKVAGREVVQLYIRDKTAHRSVPAKSCAALPRYCWNRASARR